jgi:hypothetical protein
MLFILVFIIAIMTLQYVGIYEYVVLIVVRFVLFLLPFDFLVEQSYCSELVVVMFHTVYFYVFNYLVFFILWVYSPFIFQRLVSFYVRLQLYCITS